MHITLKPNIRLGVVPTHLRFVGGLVPDDSGKYPRDAAGVIRVVSGMRELCAISPVKFSCVQVSFFPGTAPAEIDELVAGLKALGLEVDFILMVGGVNPMNPADEDAVVAQLLPNLKAAIAHGARYVSSTSIEEWMSTQESRRDGAQLEAAIAQNVKVHLRAYAEAGLAHSCCGKLAHRISPARRVQDFHQSGARLGVRQRRQQGPRQKILQAIGRCRPLRGFGSNHRGQRGAHRPHRRRG